MIQGVLGSQTQTLTLTRGQFFSGAVVWLLPKPKTNPDLDQNPNPNRGAIVRGNKPFFWHAVTL